MNKFRIDAFSNQRGDQTPLPFGGEGRMFQERREPFEVCDEVADKMAAYSLSWGLQRTSFVP